MTVYLENRQRILMSPLNWVREWVRVRDRVRDRGWVGAGVRLRLGIGLGVKGRTHREYQRKLSSK